MTRNFMYLRPGNLYKDFLVEECVQDIGATGRPKSSYRSDGSRMLRGALAEADDKQKIRWKQLQHPITHTIVQDGRPKAKPEDKLVLGDRVFLVQGADSPGSLGICTIYYVEERKDVQ